MQRLGRADAVEHRVAEARGEAALQVGGQGLAGRDRRADRGERGLGDVRIEQAGDEAGAGEEQRRPLVADQRGDLGRRRPSRVEDAAAAGRERERQRVAEAVGEEQLGDRQEAVVGSDVEDRRGRTSSAVACGAGVAVHHALRDAGRARAVQPERRRVGAGGGDRCLVAIGERRPRVGRHRWRRRRVADDDGVAQLRVGLRRARRRSRRSPGEHDDTGAGVGDDRRQVGLGRASSTAGPGRRRSAAHRGTRRGRRARRRAPARPARRGGRRGRAGRAGRGTPRAAARRSRSAAPSTRNAVRPPLPAATWRSTSQAAAL